MARSSDDLEFGQVEESEDGFRAYAEAVALHFHETFSSESEAHWRAVTEFDRTYIGRDGDRIVANSGTFSFQLSLPGDREAACAGLTAVGVAADWRRRGVLTRMMRWHVDDALERGEPFGALYASESPIYGRYGYGIAAPSMEVEIEVPFAEFLTPVDPDIDVRLVTPQIATDAFAAIHRAYRRRRGGMMSRADTWWESWFANDPPGSRDGYSPRQLASVDGRGYAVYRAKQDWADTLPQGQVYVIELIATDPEAYAALWRHVLSVDLVRTVKAPMEPVDAPLMSLVANHQRVKTRGGEDLYLRLFDVGAALAARSYDADGRLTFAVRDDFVPANTGTWTLEVSGGEASCVRSSDVPDLELDVRELAAICLGGVTTTHHVWARRIVERTEGAAARADRLFAVSLPPWNSFEF